MDRLPFALPGQFYRGNLHTHTTNSDGALSPADVAASYRAAGYDFLAITDHFLQRYDFRVTDSRDLRGDRFTTILGAELHTGQVRLGSMWHLLAVGLPLDFAPTPPDETPAALCARARATGAFVAAAHPAWYGVTLGEIEGLGQIDAIETCNATCQAENDRGDSWHVLDEAMAAGRRYLACACDDAHFRSERPDWQRAWVHVRSERLDPTALLEALHAGHYYLSTGPELYDVRLSSGNTISIACSPSSAIFVAGRGSAARRLHGDRLQQATFALDSFSSPYLRVTVVDAAGRRAWTNPIWR